MQSFRLFGHLDTFAVSARLHKHISNFENDRLVICKDTAMLETYDKWVSLQRLILKAHKFVGSMEPTRDIVIVRTPPVTVTHWDRLIDSTINMFLVPLVSNPHMLTYCHNEVAHLPVGSLNWYNHQGLGCRGNWGKDPSYHLVFSLVKAPVSEGPGNAADL